MRATLILLFCFAVSTSYSQAPPASNDVVNGIVAITESSEIGLWSFGNQIYVDFTKLKLTEATVDIYNLLGQPVYHEKVIGNSIYLKEITTIKSGYLIVKVTTGSNTFTRKLFVTN